MTEEDKKRQGKLKGLAALNAKRAQALEGMEGRAASLKEQAATAVRAEDDPKLHRSQKEQRAERAEKVRETARQRLQQERDFISDRRAERSQPMPAERVEPMKDPVQAQQHYRQTKAEVVEERQKDASRAAKFDRIPGASKHLPTREEALADLRSREGQREDRLAVADLRRPDRDLDSNREALAEGRLAKSDPLKSMNPAELDKKVDQHRKLMALERYAERDPQGFSKDVRAAKTEDRDRSAQKTQAQDKAFDRQVREALAERAELDKRQGQAPAERGKDKPQAERGKLQQAMDTGREKLGKAWENLKQKCEAFLEDRTAQAKSWNDMRPQDQARFTARELRAPSPQQQRDREADQHQKTAERSDPKGYVQSDRTPDDPRKSQAQSRLAEARGMMANREAQQQRQQEQERGR